MGIYGVLICRYGLIEDEVAPEEIDPAEQKSKAAASKGKRPLSKAERAALKKGLTPAGTLQTLCDINVFR